MEGGHVFSIPETATHRLSFKPVVSPHKDAVKLHVRLLCSQRNSSFCWRFNIMTESPNSEADSVELWNLLRFNRKSLTGLLFVLQRRCRNVSARVVLFLLIPYRAVKHIVNPVVSK